MRAAIQALPKQASRNVRVKNTSISDHVSLAISLLIVRHWLRDPANIFLFRLAILTFSKSCFNAYFTQ